MHRTQSNTTPYKMKGSPMQRNFNIGIANKTGVSGLSTKGSPVQWAWLANIGKAIGKAAQAAAKAAAKAAKAVGKGVKGLFKGGAKDVFKSGFTGKLMSKGALGKSGLSTAGVKGKMTIPKGMQFTKMPRASTELATGPIIPGKYTPPKRSIKSRLVKGKSDAIVSAQEHIQSKIGTKGDKLVTKEGLVRYGGEKGKSIGTTLLSSMATSKGEDYRAEGVRMPQLSYASSAGPKGKDLITKASGLTFRRSPARKSKRVPFRFSPQPTNLPETFKSLLMNILKK